jgi:hypothetical protein
MPNTDVEASPVLGPDALRLVAALTHTLPTVTALLAPDHGPEVVVGADRRCLPDLSPCELRRLVAAEVRGEGPALTWLSAIREVHLGGPEVQDVVEDVVRVGGRDAPVLAFATALGPLATRAVLRDTGSELMDAGTVDPCLLRSLRASTFHDEVLEVTTVVVAEPDGGSGALDVVVAAARACRVAELLDSVTTSP